MARRAARVHLEGVWGVAPRVAPAVSMVMGVVVSWVRAVQVVLVLRCALLQRQGVRLPQL